MKRTALARGSAQLVRRQPLRRVTPKASEGEARPQKPQNPPKPHKPVAMRQGPKSAQPIKPMSAKTRKKPPLPKLEGGCRLAALDPAHACQGKLHRHHRKLRSQGGTDRPCNLIPLCASAHRWAHEHPQRAHQLDLIRFGWQDEEGAA
jgi:hypothetical protein